jgi:hypothetical protein
MSYVDWHVKGREFANCNCAYGCPCQFNALPTYGSCEAVCAYQIEESHFADLRLDGLNVALLYQWPGPIHEGDGAMQAVIDARADAGQRAALAKVLHGEETEPGTTAWGVFLTTMSRVHDPIYAEIELDIDVEARRARLVVPGVIDAAGEPIRNPVTGAEHRARIDLPDGFDFTFAEMGSASTRATGDIELDLKDSMGIFARVHFTTQGVVR